ncbi:MAG: RDD family protein [Bacteroidota bacterium]
MEIITVHTAQNIDIDYEIGGFGERILARIIDYAIFLPFLFIAIILSSTIGSQATGIFAVVIFALFVFYDLICEVFFNGQSLGKRVMKIRVISLDGARPSFGQYLLRWLFRLVDFGVTGGLGALISAAVTENGQRLGDLVAGTALIRSIPRTQNKDVVYVKVDDDYVPVFSQVTQLNDKDITLVHEVISAYYKAGNSTIVYTLAEKVKIVLGIAPPPQMNSLVFLQTLIKDYSYYAAQADSL